MADQLKERFKRAAERMRANVGLSLSNEEKLELYGYYKQVMVTRKGSRITMRATFFPSRQQRALVKPASLVSLTSQAVPNGACVLIIVTDCVLRVWVYNSLVSCFNCSSLRALVVFSLYRSPAVFSSAVFLHHLLEPSFSVPINAIMYTVCSR